MKKSPSQFMRKIILLKGKVLSFTSLFFYSTRSNEVFNLRGLRKGAYVSLNDIIRFREPNFVGRDPEPLIEYWISPKDYESEIEQGTTRSNPALKINYRCKIDYVAKNPQEQGTAFVVSSATIRDGIVRTREPRLLLVPLYYMARIISGFHHP